MDMATKTRIKVWLVARQKTQQWLADQLGISPTLLSLILDGKRSASVYVRDEIAAITGVRIKVGKAA